MLIIVAIGLAACAETSAGDGSASHPEPAEVEHIDGSELSRVILSPKAAERLGIETIQVQDGQMAGAQRLVIPYSAVIYDAEGHAWTYTSPEPLVFVRHSITVDRIDGDQAILSDGPTTGVAVVTVGSAELYGTEFGVGH
jgi:hypothetical protein